MNEDPLQRLFADLKYQILAPEVTTMAACECGGSYSRGGKECVACLKDRLEKIVGRKNTDEYVYQLYKVKLLIIKKENAGRKPAEKHDSLYPMPFNYEWSEDMKKRVWNAVANHILENDPYGK